MLTGDDDVHTEKPSNNAVLVLCMNIVDVINVILLVLPRVLNIFKQFNIIIVFCFRCRVDGKVVEDADTDGEAGASHRMLKVMQVGTT